MILGKTMYKIGTFFLVFGNNPVCGFPQTGHLLRFQNILD